jgi:hypothetical protein
MTDITNIEASQRVLAHLRDGRLVQGTWHDALDDGRELACILGAIAPNIDDSSKCPAGVMPAWMAHVVVPMFDGQSEADALAWAARFGEQMGQWHVLDSVAWGSVCSAFCAACVRDAQRSAAASSAAAWAAASSADADAADAAARRACWTRMASALCDLIDAELAALAAKEGDNGKA